MTDTSSFSYEWAQIIGDAKKIRARDEIQFSLDDVRYRLTQWLSGADRCRLLGSDAGLKAYVEPYVSFASPKLHLVARELQDAGIMLGSSAISEILEGLRKRLWTCASQTMILQFGIAKRLALIDAQLLGERRRQFGHLLLDPDYRLSLFDKYTSLESVLMQICTDTCGFWKEVFSNLISDKDALIERFSIELDEVCHASFDSGDAHNRGKSVVVLDFRDTKLVYKPRSLQADAFFEKTLHELQPFLEYPIRHTGILQYEGYGWCEYIRNRPANDVADVRSCYKRMGAKIAILYILGCEDLHFENIIADIDDGFIIDVEAMFSATQDLSSIVHTQIISIAKMSPLSTLFFPTQNFSDNGILYDVSGIGYTEGQDIGFKAESRLDDTSEDDVKIESIVLGSPRSKNIPILDGRPESVLKYTDVLLEGFNHGLQAFLHFFQSDRYAAWRCQVPQVRTRFVPRSTRTYQDLLTTSLHPHAVLRGNDQRTDVLASLARDFVCFEGGFKMLPFDVASLLRGDIPLYLKECGSRSVWTSEGDEIVNVFSHSGEELFDKRIGELASVGPDRALHTAELAFACRRFDANEKAISKCEALSDGATDRNTDAELFLSAAVSIGDWLIRHAYTDHSYVSWTSPHRFDKIGFFAGPTPLSMYGGNAGISIFLSELARVTCEVRFDSISNLSALAVRQESKYANLAVGAFDGISGVLFHELVQAKRNKVLDKQMCDYLLVEILKRLPHCEAFDIISGVSGVLSVCLKARHALPGNSLVEDVVTECVAKLKSGMISHGDHVNWKEPAFDRPIIGMSHGACGIAMSLSEYAVSYDDEEILYLARKAFRFAELNFNRVSQTWPDLRSDPPSLHAGAWCHGAAGIALSRIRARELGLFATDTVISEAIEHAAELMRKLGRFSNASLCHGTAGNCEPLLRMGGIFEHEARIALRTLAAQWLETSDLHGDVGQPTPDLMDGISGIGLQFLRALDGSVSKILTLEP